MMHRLAPRSLLPTLASLFLTAGLNAQARCVDSLGGANWRSTPLRSVVVSPAGGERDVDRYTAAILPVLARHYHDPTERLQASATMISVPPESERAEFAAELQLLLDRNGKVLAASLTGSRGPAAADSAILEAAREAGLGRGFGRAPRKFRGDTLRVTIAISDRHPAATPSTPLGTVSSSYLVADVPPRVRSMPPARAPRGRRGRQVMLAATVTSAGRVLPGSIRVVQTNDSTLIPIAVRSLQRAVYRPGTRNGCPAESYIRQNFPFP